MSNGIDLYARVDEDHKRILDLLPNDLLQFEGADMAAVRERLNEVPSPDPDPAVSIEDHYVPGLEPGDPELLVRLYRPPNLPANPPALFWIHGGGMIIGSVQGDDYACAERALAHGAVIASVDYRLTPEHPFPAPMNDCYAGLVWFATQAEEIGFNLDRLAIGGASAGGGLAAGLALMVRDRGGPSICFQLLVFPMLDYRNTTASSHAIVDPRVWHRGANLFGWGAYLGSSAPTELDPSDVSLYASPSLADDVSGLPPAHINVGDLDMFLDEDTAYALALGRAGVPCEFHVYPGAFHGSNNFVWRSELSQRWKEDERQALDRALNGP